MSLYERLDADLRDAVRARDDVRKRTIRMLRASLHNQQIENRAPLDSRQELSVVQREAKRRREAASEYQRLNRGDLAEKELAELRVLQEYLPPQMSSVELTALIDDALEQTGASSERDMGRVMSALGPSVRDRADGRLVADLVRAALRGRTG